MNVVPGKLNTEELLIVACSLVVLSYLFSILSRYIRVPSVLLLLFAGIGFRAVADNYEFGISFSDRLVEALGVVGLIMIVLEAGLDLGWVTFEETNEELGCEMTFRGEPCNNVAVYRVNWAGDPRVSPDQRDKCNNPSLMCLRCFEGTTQQQDLVACAKCADGGVLRFKRIVASEFLR